MFEIDKQWIERLYQALYLARLFGAEELVDKLSLLELKFFNSELEDFEWAMLADIEDELEIMRN